MSIHPLIVKLRLTTRSPALRSSLIYLFVAPTSSAISTLVGSASEYRFPHSLATTTLHLIISLLSLLLVRFVIVKVKLKRVQGQHRRQLSSSVPLGHEDKQSMNKNKSIQTYLTPTNLASTLLSTLSSILQSHSFHNVSNASPINTLPIPFLFLISFFEDLSISAGVTKFSLPISITGVIGLVLFLGEGVRSWSDESMKESLVRIGLMASYALGVLGWVLSLKLSMKEGSTSTNSPPTVTYHLTSTLCLFIPALLFSGELTNIYNSGHFGFFTEVGFWVQEIVISWCGLINLLMFWNLVQNLDPMTIFALVGIKDHYLPSFYSFVFGNKMGLRTGTTILSPTQQHLIFFFISLYSIVDWIVQSLKTEDSISKKVSLDNRSKIG